ncbi:MAG: hemin uptake protein HemP [Gammaproteobacteria bacterium]|nr:hemin uptake protein HemP [Gammaproteobacteria bacterium]
MAEPPSSDSNKPGTGPEAPRLPTFSSLDLFGSWRCIHIEHQGQVYRLQITRQGKLILTK